MFDIKKKILELDGKQARNTSELTDEQIRELILENERLIAALKDIVTRGKGNGGLVVVTSETLRGIARAALENK